MGDSKLESTADSNAIGEAQAWSYTATANGTATDADVYIDTPNGAKTIVAGLYSSQGGHPGKLLASGTLTSPKSGAWNDVQFSSTTSVTSGTQYWLALLGTDGTFNFRDNKAGSCSTIGSQFGLSSMPSSWRTTWTTAGYCGASFYVNATVASGTTGGASTTGTTGTTTGTTGTSGSGSGTTTTAGSTTTTPTTTTPTTTTPTTTTTTTTTTTSTTPPPTPPSNTGAPAITGTVQQGSSLKATSGTWSGTAPITYQYQWSDGATGSTDTLTAADVGKSVSVTVTATNAAGFAVATSASVGPVTSSSSSSTPTSALVPCALTHAAGADPNTSCWATHTGVLGATGYTEAQIEANPAADGFTKHVGDLTITQPNTTIDHEWIVGCISIADGANNVTIKDSLVTPNGDTCGGDNAAASAINTGQGSSIAKNTLVEDTTVDGGTPAYGTHYAGIMLDEGEALRVNLFGFAQGFVSGENTASAPALFQDDYGHDYYGCSHDDGTWFDSSSYVTFEHGWIMTNDPTRPASGEGCSTGALTGGADYGPQDHVVFDNSYGEGVTGEDSHAGCGSTYSAYTNDVFSTDAKDYGSGFVATDTGNTWSGNSVIDTSGASQGVIADPQGATCPG